MISLFMWERRKTTFTDCVLLYSSVRQTRETQHDFGTEGEPKVRQTTPQRTFSSFEEEAKVWFRPLTEFYVRFGDYVAEKRAPALPFAWALSCEKLSHLMGCNADLPDRASDWEGDALSLRGSRRVEGLLLWSVQLQS